jgi:hypothetical protein
MVLVNNISARKISRFGAKLVVLLSDCKRQAVEQLTGEYSTPTLDFFRAISAGECLVVSIVALCGAKLNSLTPLGSVGLPLLVEKYYVAHLACGLMQCNLVLQASARLARD